MGKTISVVIPIYNVAAYLPQCMDSLLTQSYSDLEIILIDDGSTDDSPALCDAYAKQDARVKVIHQKNGGAASAKNAGLRVATGQYLSFVDSDDYLEPGAYAHMVSLLTETGADAVQCSFRDVYQDGTEDVVTLPQQCEFTTTEYLTRFTVDWTCCLLWDKLFKRKLFEGIYFEEGHIIDDEFFTYQGIMNAARILHDPQIVYNYRKRRSSVTARPEYLERTIFDKLDYLLKRRNKVVDRFPELQCTMDHNYVIVLLWTAKLDFATKNNIAQIQAAIRAHLKRKDRSPVPLRMWLRLQRFCRVGTNRLMNERGPKGADDNLSRFFA